MVVGLLPYSTYRLRKETIKSLKPKVVWGRLHPGLPCRGRYKKINHRLLSPAEELLLIYFSDLLLLRKALTQPTILTFFMTSTLKSITRFQIATVYFSADISVEMYLILKVPTPVFVFVFHGVMPPHRCDGITCSVINCL